MNLFSIFEQVYAELNVSSVRAKSDDISPYVRARGTVFPCVQIYVPNVELERDSEGAYRAVSDVSLQCLARSVKDAEELAQAVYDAVTDDYCNAVESIERSYEEGNDDDSVGFFIVTINYKKYGA